MSTYTLSALRAGQPYESLDKVELKSVRTGEVIATIGQVNAGIIRRDLRRINPDVLRNIPIARLVEMYAEAGRLFMNETVGGLSPEEYIHALSETSGLPHSLVKRNMGKIYQVFTELPTILNGLTRGLPLEILDSGYGEQAGVPVSYFPTANALGVVLPSNSPGVNSLWLPALALKTPVVLKPGREEPWTPLRIVHSLIAAGVPAEAFYFYPTDHEGSGAVMEVCQRALIFGDQSTVERYASNPNVEVHGPGWSKVVIGDDCIEHWPEFIELLASSIAENGGRSCINASGVLVPRHGADIAEALAKRLAEITPRAPDDPEATLSGFANPKMAEWMDGAIDEGLATPGATEATAQYHTGSRRVERDGSTYLLPTLIHCDSFSHPLANREFLFPYASIVEVPQEKMVELMGPSLVVTAITQDQAFLKQLLASPHIERLNIGPIPTTRVEWNQPHEGNLFEFLYRRRSLQWAKS
ncbi:MAG: aldehyde dehydrogenase family protein [Armatimonas sp.]